MVKPLSADAQREYERDKAFVLYLAAALGREVDHELQAREKQVQSIDLAGTIQASLQRMESRAPRTAARGLAQARNDLVAMAQDLPPSRVTELDHELAERGLPTLSQVRAGSQASVVAIIKRGRIRNETEYYLVTEGTNATADGMPDATRQRLGELVLEFEQRKAKPRPDGAA